MKKSIFVSGLALLFAISGAMGEETKPKPKVESDKKADTTATPVKKADTSATVKKVDTSTVAKKLTDTTSKETIVAEWTTTESGLKYRDLVVGKGSEAAMGTNANCHYTLWLADEKGEKGKLVQSSKGGDPFKCQVGYQLISGWSEGMVGMKEGGTRELIVHPGIGYGNQAKGNMIPANSTLYFEIEYLNEIKK